VRKKSLHPPEYWIIQRPWAEDELEFQIKDATTTQEARPGQEFMGPTMGNIPIEYFGLLFGLKLSIKQWFFKLNWSMHKTLEAKN
jgi:hypothetical protein